MKTTPFLLALLALTAAALAQEQAAPTPADAAKLGLARDVIAVMHVDQMFDGMTAQIKQMATQMTPPMNNLTAAQKARFAEFQGKVMDLSMAGAKAMVAKMDRIYADVYSEPELRAMKAFFASPEGQSMLAKQPQVMAHLMPLIKEMQQDLMPKFQQLAQQLKEDEVKDEAPAMPAAPAEAPAAPEVPLKK